MVLRPVSLGLARVGARTAVRSVSTTAPAFVRLPLALPLAFPSTATSSSVAAALRARGLHTSSALGRTPMPIPPTSPLVPRSKHAGHSSGSSSSTGAGASGSAQKPQTIYNLWYREILPAMIPIFIMATCIFLALSLARTYLSNARSLDESTARIAALEAQIARLRHEAKRRQERERRERERILPFVVERVLQRVGAMGPEEEDGVEDVVEDRLLV